MGKYNCLHCRFNNEIENLVGDRTELLLIILMSL